MEKNIEVDIKKAVDDAEKLKEEAKWKPVEIKDDIPDEDSNIDVMEIIASLDQAAFHLKNGRFVKTADFIKKARDLVSEL